MEFSKAGGGILVGDRDMPGMPGPTAPGGGICDAMGGGGPEGVLAPPVLPALPLPKLCGRDGLSSSLSYSKWNSLGTFLKYEDQNY